MDRWERQATGLAALFSLRAGIEHASCARFDDGGVDRFEFSSDPPAVKAIALLVACERSRVREEPAPEGWLDAVDECLAELADPANAELRLALEIARSGCPAISLPERVDRLEQVVKSSWILPGCDLERARTELANLRGEP